MNSINKSKTKYRRRLTPAGVAQAELEKISTWDERFDGLKDKHGRVIEPSMAFDWDIDDIQDGNNTIKRSKSLNHMRVKNAKDKNTFTDSVTNVNQFFYSTKSLQQLIQEMKGSLDYMIKKRT